VDARFSLIVDGETASRRTPRGGDGDKHRARILPAPQYYDLLAPRCDIDVWRTTHHHRMDDAAAIVQWLCATGPKPHLDPLTPDHPAVCNSAASSSTYCR
jgi:trans-aconitate methyltransferase